MRWLIDLKQRCTSVCFYFVPNGTLSIRTHYHRFKKVTHLIYLVFGDKKPWQKKSKDRILYNALSALCISEQYSLIFHNHDRLQAWQCDYTQSESPTVWIYKVWESVSIQSLEAWQCVYTKSESLTVRVYKVWEPDSVCIQSLRAWQCEYTKSGSLTVCVYKVWEPDSMSIQCLRAWQCEYTKSESLTVWVYKVWEPDSESIQSLRAWQYEYTKSESLTVWVYKVWEPDSVSIQSLRAWQCEYTKSAMDTEMSASNPKLNIFQLTGSPNIDALEHLYNAPINVLPQRSVCVLAGVGEGGSGGTLWIRQAITCMSEF